MGGWGRELIYGNAFLQSKHHQLQLFSYLKAHLQNLGLGGLGFIVNEVLKYN